jgi:hypothetical protein
MAIPLHQLGRRRDARQVEQSLNRRGRVTVERTAHIRAVLGRQPGATRARLCVASVEILAVDCLGISLMGGAHTGVVCASNALAQKLEDLQFTLGEGPCRDSLAAGTPVLAPELGTLDPDPWPAFSGSALDSGVRAVFAFPLRANGDRPLGVMTVYQLSVGSLTAEQFADGVVLARVIAERVLAIQAGAGQGEVADELANAAEHRAEVHQASGMVAVQLGVGVSEALTLLRAHAFATNRPLPEVAADIVGRRLRLTDDSPPAT